MANTKYGYVRNFELPDPLLPGTFLVFRLDGHSFHRFSDVHNFTKPNDVRALQLMDHAAKDVMEAHPDITLAFGESDEYSFLLKKSTSLFNRRESKINSTLTSEFTSSYVYNWSKYFPDLKLQYPPSFDGRVVLYPNEKVVKDYFAWRQADTHINNLYNTTFWALVLKGGQTTTEAHATLRGTYSKDKHEILYTRFKINYNILDARFRKGSVLVRSEIQDIESSEYPPESSTSLESLKSQPSQSQLEVSISTSILTSISTSRLQESAQTPRQILSGLAAKNDDCLQTPLLSLTSGTLDTTLTSNRNINIETETKSSTSSSSSLIPERHEDRQNEDVAVDVSKIHTLKNNAVFESSITNITDRQIGDISFESQSQSQSQPQSQFQHQSQCLTNSNSEPKRSSTGPPHPPTQPSSSSGSIFGSGSSSDFGSGTKSHDDTQTISTPTTLIKQVQKEGKGGEKGNNNNNNNNNNKKTKKMKTKTKTKKTKVMKIELMHCDVIKDEFWDVRPWLLED